MDKVKKCKHCKHWDYTSNNFGFCRATAPVPMPMVNQPGMELTLCWPSTGTDDWCAQFDKAQPGGAGQ